jgi:hypothetical protein
MARGGASATDAGHGVPRVSPRLIVGVFGGMRTVIGLGFLLAPNRSARQQGGGSATLMTRSFAVREAVLGIGALISVVDADTRSSLVRTWAALGALTDAGDVAAGMVAMRRGEPSAGASVVLAAAGLGAELWAFTAPARVVAAQGSLGRLRFQRDRRSG